MFCLVLAGVLTSGLTLAEIGRIFRQQVGWHDKLLSAAMGPPRCPLSSLPCPPVWWHPLLVSRVVNQMKISGQVVENLVRGLGPDERLGILIPRIDPGPKVGLQLGDAAVG